MTDSTEHRLDEIERRLIGLRDTMRTGLDELDCRVVPLELQSKVLLRATQAIARVLRTVGDVFGGSTTSATTPSHDMAALGHLQRR